MGQVLSSLESCHPARNKSFFLTSSVAEEDSNFQAMLRSNPEDAQANVGKMESLLTNNMEPQPIGLEDGLDKN